MGRSPAREALDDHVKPPGVPASGLSMIGHLERQSSCWSPGLWGSTRRKKDLAARPALG
jgi:hypothetical protein